MKITVTGDSILLKEIPKDYAAFEEIRDYICQGDVRINNLEMVISEGDKFASTYCGGIWLTGKPERLDDVAYVELGNPGIPHSVTVFSKPFSEIYCSKRCFWMPSPTI